MPNPVERGSDIVPTIGSNSFTIPWPSGTLNGDLAVIMMSHGSDINPPSGWTVKDLQNGISANMSGAVFCKILDAADIAAGNVVITTAANWDGISAIVTYVGPAGGVAGVTIQGSVPPIDDPGVASSTITKSTLATDQTLYWGYVYSNAYPSQNATVDRGVSWWWYDTGFVSASLFVEDMTVDGPISPTFSYLVTGLANYQVIVSVALYEELVPHGTPPSFGFITPWQFFPFNATASSENFPAIYAFDGSFNYFQSWYTGNSISPPHWLQMDLGAGALAIPGSYGIETTNAPFSATVYPKDWTFEGSLDGITWAVLDTQTFQLGWAALELRRFPLSGSTPYRYFRLNISANAGDPTWTVVSEFYLAGTWVTHPYGVIVPLMTADNAPSPLVASASAATFGHSASTVFARDPTAQWIAAGAGVNWVQISLGGKGTVYAYAVEGSPAYSGGGSSGSDAAGPKDWLLRGSNNGSTWTTLDARTGEPMWNNTAPPTPPGTSVWPVQETRMYQIATPAAYRYYRFQFTANQGDASFDNVSQLILYGIKATDWFTLSSTKPNITHSIT